uniref:Uncharacterized protein n=1 Tax=Octopus bimaculoides TaxID=37653 RepID=A0A0L8HJ03_OCTBM
MTATVTTTKNCNNYSRLFCCNSGWSLCFAGVDVAVLVTTAAAAFVTTTTTTTITTTTTTTAAAVTAAAAAAAVIATTAAVVPVTAGTGVPTIASITKQNNNILPLPLFHHCHNLH